MELCDINLAQYIYVADANKHIKGLSDWSTVNRSRQVVLIMKQVLSGLKFIHSHDKVHRDLKPENSKFVHRHWLMISLIFGAKCMLENRGFWPGLEWNNDGFKPH